MIAADLMYFDQLRASWKRVLAVTVGVALTNAILASGLTQHRKAHKTEHADYCRWQDAVSENRPVQRPWKDAQSSEDG
jgi:hypothetical protein